VTTDAGSRPHLVSVEWLGARTATQNLRIVDATPQVVFSPEGRRQSIESGREGFEGAHIPGAVFADLTCDLSDPDSPFPFTLPSEERFANAVGQLGIGDETHVVIYDRQNIMWATRLWWLFRVFGASRVSVLDGGLKAWIASGRPTCAGSSAHPPALFHVRLRPELLARRADVLASIGSIDTCLISASRPDIFRGDDTSPLPRRGHIPGSVNVPATLFDAETNLFLPIDELRQRFVASRALERERVVTYCGGGIAATVDAFALALLGRDDVAVYDGSLEDWTSDPSLPLDIGNGVGGGRTPGTES
jgi:thiosulfate/3-mercaptopyruvate sulfurtransferase